MNHHRHASSSLATCPVRSPTHLDPLGSCPPAYLVIEGAHATDIGLSCPKGVLDAIVVFDVSIARLNPNGWWWSRRTPKHPFSSFCTSFLLDLILLSSLIFRSLVLSRVPPTATSMPSTSFYHIWLPAYKRVRVSWRLNPIPTSCTMRGRGCRSGTVSRKRRNWYRIAVAWR